MLQEAASASRPISPGPAPGSFTDAVRRNIALTKLEDMVAWGQKYSVWPFNFGLSCCYVEMATAFTSKFDIARFGSEGCAPPHANPISWSFRERCS